MSVASLLAPLCQEKSKMDQPALIRLCIRNMLYASFLALATTAYAQDGTDFSLTGDAEVPPVATPAVGSGKITVSAEHSVSGSITTSGIVATAAHIHEGNPGKNGPVVVALTKSADSTYSVPDGTRFSDTQYASYLSGAYYINVHSAAHPGGEIRGQLLPAQASEGTSRSGY
jgi:hypothetical protein